jgi:hypothetical protein
MKKNLTIELWNDSSHEAKTLVRRLEESGYSVKSIRSGSTTPSAAVGRFFVTGYASIVTTFVDEWRHMHP